MSTHTTALPPSNPAKRLLARGLVLSVWAGALAGAVIGVAALADRGPTRGPAAPGIAKLHQRVTTSFGTMSVDYVVKLVGAPNPMGLSDAPGQLPIQVGVTLTNLDKRPLRFTPRMFEMPRIATGGVDVGRLEGGRMPSLSQHRFTLRYSIADAASLPRLKFHDPGRAAPVLVELGSSRGLGTLNVLNHHFSRRFAG
ncbi:MAG TPA: hypothetical protein VGJ32_01315 [Solirubrobacteraceae bacterium]